MSRSAPDRRALSRKIKSLREEANWSQSELARRAGVTAAAVSMIESGQRTPSLTMTRKLSEALKVSLSELTGEPPRERADQDMRAFFRDFGELQQLTDAERQAVLDMVRKLKGNR